MNIVIIAMLVGGLWPFGHSGQTETSRYLIPAWHVDTVSDRFTGRTRCRVFQGSRQQPSVSYARGTLAFAFARSRNTLNADFRVDNGPTRPWTSVYPAVIGTGATLTGVSMTNPTQGFVILPISILNGATTVSIRSRPKDRPQVSVSVVSGMRSRPPSGWGAILTTGSSVRYSHGCGSLEIVAPSAARNADDCDRLRDRHRRRCWHRPDRWRALVRTS